MDAQTPQTRRCKATNRAGEQCKKAPMKGGMVCRAHGGAAPQTRKKAALRLLELIDPAIATLAREMTMADKSSDRLKAADSILDRAGMPRKTTVDSVSANELLIARVRELREEAGMPEDERMKMIEGNTDDND